MNVSKADAQADPEQSFQKSAQKGNPVKWIATRKPDPFDLALYGLVVTVIIGIIYFFQLRTMGQTMDITRRVSERDERAWLAVRNIAQLNTIPGQPIATTFRVTNVGKTPASNVLCRFFVEIIPSNKTPSFDYYPERASATTRMGDLYPTDYVDCEVVRRRNNGKHFPEIVDEVVNMSDDEFFWLTSGKSYAAVHGIITYQDAFRVQHWETICLWWWRHVGNYSTATCVEHNQHDDNDEP